MIIIMIFNDNNDFIMIIEGCNYQDVDKAIDFLKQSFWQYGTNEAKYNYTKDQFKLVLSSSPSSLSSSSSSRSSAPLGYE